MKNKKGKLLMLILIVATLVFSGFALPTKADAALTGWKNVKTGGQVRIYTDYTTYTSKATSVDTYIQSNGKTGTLYYSGIINSGEQSGANSITGSFSSQSPVKQLKFLKGGPWKGTFFVTYFLYSDAKHTKYIGSVSATLNGK
ncbi:cell wall-binding protein [Listeria booriae]|uniref:Cell wall-binding protein n=1 Tax=Listeria booriae TaxID=1552123 RepID=A0A841XWQ3_9LIST|nr:cell wall-binding protein [Listeria booriae]MBC1209313.1 cell wall-binding protein [Listeria booriae]MBC1316100.1 cell wall-binding protein [Listeria booriae]